MCKYEKIGCHWQGTVRTQADHEERCAQTRKTGLEIMENLEKSSTEEKTKLNLHQSIFALFSYGRTSIHGMRVVPLSCSNNFLSNNLLPRFTATTKADR